LSVERPAPGADRRKRACSKIAFRGSLRGMLGWSTVEDLYARYSRSVFRRSRAMLGNDVDAREVTQGVFRRIIKLGGPLPSEPAAPMAWFYRVTTDLCLHRLRHDKPRAYDLDDKEDTQVTGAPVPAGVDAEAHAFLRDLLETIPHDLQEIGVYFFLDQLTLEEIAAIVGVSSRTVVSRLGEFRALVERMFPDLRRMAS